MFPAPKWTAVPLIAPLTASCRHSLAELVILLVAAELLGEFAATSLSTSSVSAKMIAILDRISR